MQAEASVAQVVVADDTVSPSSTSGPIPGLVWAFRIHSDGSPEALPVDEPISFAHDGLLWLHFKGLPFTDLDTAFLWASLLMVLSSFAAYLIMKRIGIIR